MSQDHLSKLKSTKSNYVYYTRKNKKKVERKLSFNRYDPTPGVQAHVEFKESKK